MNDFTLFRTGRRRAWRSSRVRVRACCTAGESAVYSWLNLAEKERVALSAGPLQLKCVRAAVVEDEEMGEVLQFQGDQRDAVSKFLTENGAPQRAPAPQRARCRDADPILWARSQRLWRRRMSRSTARAERGRVARWHGGDRLCRAQSAGKVCKAPPPRRFLSDTVLLRVCSQKAPKRRSAVERRNGRGSFCSPSKSVVLAT